MAIPRKSRTTPSPAPASGSTGVTNSTSSPSQASAPGWMVAVAPWVFWGSLVILIALAMRWVPFNWGWMVFFAILGGGASLFIKKNKLVGFFRWIATGILIVTMLSAWFAPNLPQAVENYQPGVPSPQEQVAPPSPTPSSEIGDRTQFSNRGGAILSQAQGKINISPGSELCISDFRDSDGSGFNQIVFLIKVGEEEERVFSTRASKCWDIPEGDYTYRVGDSVSAEIPQYRKNNQRLPVIRPK